MDIPNQIEKTSGFLAIVATPIGNLEDITLRALRTLKESDIIFAEDTRRTRILLEHFNIHKRLEAYHIFNEHGKTPELLKRVKNGEKIALVSDAGTPCIADPGFLLVRSAVEANIEPIFIPGVSALTFSISASALPADKFTFLGFLPVKKGRRTKAIESIANENKSCVIFESPFRIEKLLREIADSLGECVRIALIREATKVHEHVYRGTVGDVIKQTQGQNWKGECVLVVFKDSENEDSSDVENDGV